VNDLVVREATPADLEPMVRLLGVLFALEADFSPSPERQRRGLSRLLADPARRCALLAAREGEVIGMVTVQLLVSTAEGGDSALLEDLVVDDACRGAGVGRRLLEAAVDWARARGATRAQLLADRENAPALGFYARMGWERTQLVLLRRGGALG
jgi:GNAT superfamily N-acetyltransferase